MTRNKQNEDLLLERKKALLNQLHPLMKKSTQSKAYDLFRKNKIAEILKIEKALARLKGYYSRVDQ